MQALSGPLPPFTSCVGGGMCVWIYDMLCVFMIALIQLVGILILLIAVVLSFNVYQGL